MDLLGSTLLLLAQGNELSPEPQRPVNLLESPLVLLAVVFFVFYFLIIRPQRKEEQRKRELLGALKKNDRVVTTGGMFGTIVNVKDDEVTLRIDDQAKVKVRLLKSAIARVVEGGTEGAAEPADASKKS